MNARQTLVGVCLLLAFAAGTAAERFATFTMEPADASTTKRAESAAAEPDKAIEPAKVTTVRVVYPSSAPGSTPTTAPPPETFSPIGSAVAAPAPVFVLAKPVIVRPPPVDTSLREAALQTLAREIEARARAPAEPAEPSEEHAALAPEAVLPREKPASPRPREEGGRSGALDLNTASLAELNTLRGVGRIGRSIIRGRPYRSPEDLVSKRILRRSAYERIRSRIAVR